MRKALLVLAALSLMLPLFARSRYNTTNQTISISTDDWDEITSCDQINVRIDGERAVMREEVLPAGNIRSLRGHASRNGGIRVTGWDRPDWSIKACRATSADGSGSGGMRPYLRGEELGVEGEGESDTVIFFLVRAPRNAVLNLEAHNGELGIQGVSGSLTARTQNGPISLKEVSGTVDAEAQNGPISFAGNAGKVRLEAQNGPVTVQLTGSSWNGSLDASTHNGPLSLKIPRDYRSGVVVESDGHGPISCRAEACRQARRTWGNDDDDDNDSMRRIELGSGAQNVRMSTTNGPVSVKEGS